MEGPTPVSALIHSATMVTAGVYLLIRCSPLYEYSPKILIFVLIIGSMTTIFGSSVGILQNDVKKIIAYSTCSQLGYMVLACGLSNYEGSFYHLLNHAFFKALLFLSAGALIHSVCNEQDIRRFGNLLLLLPFIYTVFLVGSICLMGVPCVGSFYSKDFIIEYSIISSGYFEYFANQFAVVSIILTSCYSYRLLNLSFFNNYMVSCYKSYVLRINETTPLMATSLLILSLISFFFGFYTKEIFLGLGTDFFFNSIYFKPNNVVIGVEFYSNFNLKCIPLIFTILGICTGWVFSDFFYTLNKLSNFILILFIKVIKIWFIIFG